MLLWHRVANPVPVDMYRSERFLERVPSWSWTCLDAEICITWQEWFFVNLYIKVCYSRIYHSGDPFGQAEGGLIRLQGPLFEFRPTETPRYAGANPSLFEYNTPGTLPTFLASQIKWHDSPIMREYQKSVLFFLLIEDSPFNFGVSGIILYPTELGRGQYQRLGMINDPLLADSGLKALVDIGKCIDMLQPEMYLEADLELGFMIDIV
jgi:hypothetical protein